MKYLVIFFFVPMITHADIYKCNKTEKLIFSDIPCAHDAEKIQVKTTNQSNGYINDSYLNKMDFETSDNQRINKINSVIRIVVSKGKDCKHDLKESKKMERCFDYMNYVMAGGVYRKAYNNFRQFTKNRNQKNLTTLVSEIDGINKNIKLVAEYTSLLRSFMNDN